MKKSILALSTLAVVGGLGLAGSAQAVFFFGAGIDAATPTWQAAGSNTAVALELNPGSTGHELIVPYFSAQPGTNTLLNIVNTDQVNGKAVKVRFRGASNSDDLFDFTLFLSPGDVWSGNVSMTSDGVAGITDSGDNTCKIPSGAYNHEPFNTRRLASYLGATQKNANTREGYVEILNMADIPPTTMTGSTGNNTAAGVPNDLFLAIKHVNRVPPCARDWHSGLKAGLDAIDLLWDPAQVAGNAQSLLNDFGLSAPSGGLTGGWIVVNQTNHASYSGNDTAVRAYLQPADGVSNGASGTTWVMFSPQNLENYEPGPAINTLTADPAFTGGSSSTARDTNSFVSTQWNDLPDLSSPMGLLGGNATVRNARGIATAVDSRVRAGVDTTPTAQADILANALGKTSINDEYIYDPDGSQTGVRTTTEWVLSEPTRRYFAVVNYADAANNSRVVYNTNGLQANGNASGVAVSTASAGYLPFAGAATTEGGAAVANVGAGNLTLLRTGAYGPVLCSTLTPKFFDREETTAGPAFSPGGVNAQICGEVSVITWGPSSLNASITQTNATNTDVSGWGNFRFILGDFGAPYGVPMTGFAALTGVGYSGNSLGATWPLRW